jgi:WhiB family redox-sensing transcriptional regulator
VLEPCRRHALAVQEPYGVWGGLSEAERDEIVRGRTRRLRVTGLRPAPVAGH